VTALRPAKALTIKPATNSMPTAHQQGYIANWAPGNAKAQWASSFLTCQAARCRTKHMMFRLNKLAGWVAEVAARNFNNHATP